MQNKFIHEKLKMGKWYKENYLDKMIIDRYCDDEDWTFDYSKDIWITHLIKRLVELNMWETFYNNIYDYWLLNIRKNQDTTDDEFAAWWCQQPRFRDLLFDYLKQEKA